MFMMKLLEETRKKSRDPNTKIGAIVFRETAGGTEVVSTGYNVYPNGLEPITWDRKSAHPNDTKYPYVIHAEQMAILNAKKDIQGYSMFCTTSPCNECMKLILHSGIKKLYILNDQHNGPDFNIQGKIMMEKSGIEVIRYYD